MQRYAAVAGLRKRLGSCRCRVLSPRCRATGSAWSRRCRRAWPGRWWSRCGTRWLRRARHRRVRARSAGGPDRLRRGGRAGAEAHPERRGRHPLVVGRGAGRAERPAADRPGLGRRLAVHGRARAARSTPRPSALWQVIEGIGGRERLVLLASRLGGARAARPAGRRRRASARPARPAHLRIGDALDFWRVEEIEPRPAAAAARRDAAARPGLARAVAWTSGTAGTGYRQRALFHPRGLPGQRTGGASAVPRHHLRPHAAQHPAGRRSP